ncbi:YjbH domain-containing protein [Pacificoceanicola onchidii]|uniref:YjbH domain-containing protein n=1 Tax=Pacificoceanicola onchidii TaxID=2562685 RepID=UPI001F0ED6CA|nr:YjbH domain-containing protein [Pacificoceanicola onchidii]
MRLRIGSFAVSLCLAMGIGSEAVSQSNPWTRPTLSFTGVPGIVDMPTAHQMQDADLTATLGFVDGTARTTFHFQITPRLSGVFRYTAFGDFFNNGVDYYDRSFDLRYQLLQEGRYHPAVTVALQDFGGTGVFAGEYVVATKTFGKLRATGGIGWGRFGSYNGFTNPLGLFSDRFKVRPNQTRGVGQTGRLDTSHWFRGDAALFGGLEYAVNDRLRLGLEYSSDNYDLEQTNAGFDRSSPFNFGLNYRFRNGVDMRAAYLYGSTVAVQFSYTLNPKKPRRSAPVLDGGPPPLLVRAPGAAANLGWTQQDGAAENLRDQVAQVLAADGLALDGFSVRARRVLVRFRNPTDTNTAQSIGRIARTLSVLMPASVEQFEIVPVSGNGLALSRITLNRSDLEELEYAPDGAWQSFARARIEDATTGDLTADLSGPATPSFTWRIGPYLQATYFDPDSPIRVDVGVEGTFRYEPVSGLVLSGGVRHRLSGNRGETRPSESVLPHVRSDVGLYAEAGETALTNLTIAHYFRPGKDLYGRVTAGYLETMYAGVSGELLWKPVNSRLALGVELNYVRQREFDQGFGLRDYDILTGHVSAYYKASNDFHYQLDVGRYLAGDWGATLTIDREFANGIKVGAFATLTDVPFDTFGEGSFDKGLRFEIPVSAFTGRKSTNSVSRTIRPVLRDGGARLNVNGRLYNDVRDYHQSDLQKQWGRFWR